MTVWSTKTEPILSARGELHRVLHGQDALSYESALDLLRTSSDFRSFLSGVITRVSYKAIRWETPAVTRDSIGRPFEFVLVDDPVLEARPEPHVFSSYFEA